MVGNIYTDTVGPYKYFEIISIILERNIRFNKFWFLRYYINGNFIYRFSRNIWFKLDWFNTYNIVEYLWKSIFQIDLSRNKLKK